MTQKELEDRYKRCFESEEKKIDEIGHFVEDGQSYDEKGVVIASDDQLPKAPSSSDPSVKKLNNSV